MDDGEPMEFSIVVRAANLDADFLFEPNAWLEPTTMPSVSPPGQSGTLVSIVDLAGSGPNIALDHALTNHV